MKVVVGGLEVVPRGLVECGLLGPATLVTGCIAPAMDSGDGSLPDLALFAVSSTEAVAVVARPWGVIE